MLLINFVTYKECLYKECHGTMGEGGKGAGVESYKRTWPSINHSILSATYPARMIVCQEKKNLTRSLFKLDYIPLLTKQDTKTMLYYFWKSALLSQLDEKV